VNLDFLDRYAALDSPIHRLDGRVKLLLVLACLSLWVTTPPGHWFPLGFALLLLAAASAASKVPLRYLLSRSLPAAGFVALVAILTPFSAGDSVLVQVTPGIAVSREGALLYASVVSKAFLSVSAVVLLSATTSFAGILQSMERLRVPRSLVQIVSFAYRYLFVIVEEALRMRRARDARLFGGRWLWHSRVIGQMIGTLFLRSYERAERVYQAMIARGFDPAARPRQSLPLTRADVTALVAVPALVLASRLVPLLAGLP
jgi:cobalt/nickel transport system permease protein